MALNKNQLKNDIRSLLDNMSERQDNPEQSREDFAQQLSTLIDSYIKSATISIPTLTVQVNTATGTGTTVPATTSTIQ